MFTTILRTAAYCRSPLLAFQQVKKPFPGKAFSPPSLAKPRLEPIRFHGDNMNANQQPQYTWCPKMVPWMSEGQGWGREEKSPGNTSLYRGGMFHRTLENLSAGETINSTQMESS